MIWSLWCFLCLFALFLFFLLPLLSLQVLSSVYQKCPSSIFPSTSFPLSSFLPPFLPPSSSIILLATSSFSPPVFPVWVKSFPPPLPQLNVTLEKNVAGFWVKVPCLEELGSCHYRDACDVLTQLIPPGQSCPEPLHTYGLPCRCPFKAVSPPLPS